MFGLTPNQSVMLVPVFIIIVFAFLYIVEKLFRKPTKTKILKRPAPWPAPEPDTIQAGFICILDSRCDYIAKRIYSDEPMQRIEHGYMYLYPNVVYKGRESIEKAIEQYADQLDWSDLVHMQTCHKVFVCGSASASKETAGA